MSQTDPTDFLGSDIKVKEANDFLVKQVYSDQAAWKRFLRYFLLSLGLGFTVSGIVFFFAYNWADLPKFAKFTLLEVFVAGLMAIVIFSRIKPVLRNIVLTAAALVTGVLFAVYSQVYQTGADAYDFFFGWTLAISLWVFVSGFAPLWLLWVSLINISISLYLNQVMHGQSEVLLLVLLFLVNTTALTMVNSLRRLKEKQHVSWEWFEKILVLAITSLGTMVISTCIFRTPVNFPVYIGLVSLLYIAGFLYGNHYKKLIYISTILFSLIIVVVALIQPIIKLL